jgi:hypothetical protein
MVALKYSDEKDFMILGEDKLPYGQGDRGSREFRGSRFRGVSKNKGKWQVSCVQLTFRSGSLFFIAERIRDASKLQKTPLKNMIVQPS